MPVHSVSSTPAGSAGRGRGRPGNDQESVLRSAVAVFNRQGYDATSVADLARELGISKSAVYHHVPSKEHLLALALDPALDGLEGVLTSAEALEEASAYARLVGALRGAVRLLVERQPEVMLLLRVRGNSEVEQRALTRRRQIDARLARLVRGAMEEGALRPDVAPALAARLIFGMVNSLVEWHRVGTDDADDLADAVVALAFEGLRSS